jgi:hypothetical protein
LAQFALQIHLFDFEFLLTFPREITSALGKIRMQNLLVEVTLFVVQGSEPFLQFAVSSR